MPLVIEAAINGSTSKDANPHVPRTVDEIVATALACVGAGASIVHNHNGLEDYAGSDQPTNEELVDRAVQLGARCHRSTVGTGDVQAALWG